MRFSKKFLLFVGSFALVALAMLGCVGGGPGGRPDPSSCTDLPTLIDADMTVGPGCYLVSDTTVSGATLTISPGTWLLMEPGAWMATAWGGAIVAKGTAAEEIVFTSSANAPTAGDWECVRLDSSNSEMSYVRFEYGGAACGVDGAGIRGMLQAFTNVLDLSNLTFTDSDSIGVYVAGDVRGFSGNTFARNADHGITVRQPNLLSLTGGHTFEDAGDYILVDEFMRIGVSGIWHAQAVPYRTFGNVDISGANVTVEAGTTIQMNGSIYVLGGSLDTAGTVDAPVIFTSAQAFPAAGDWGCVEGWGATIDYAIFEYGGAGCGGANIDAMLVGDDMTTVTNTVFRDSAGDGIRGYFATDTTCPMWCPSNTFTNLVGSDILCGGSATTPFSCP